MQAFAAQSGREVFGVQKLVVRLGGEVSFIFNQVRTKLVMVFGFDASGTQCPCYRQIVHERRRAQGFLLGL